MRDLRLCPSGRESQIIEIKAQSNAPARPIRDQIAPIDVDHEPSSRFDALEHREPEGGGQEARASRPRTRPREGRAARRAGSPALSPATTPTATSDDRHRREPRLRQSSAGTRRSATHSGAPTSSRSPSGRRAASRRHPDEPAAPAPAVGSVALARIGISETAAPATGLGNHERLGRPLDPHVDPPRAAVALDHDRARGAAGRSSRAARARPAGRSGRSSGTAGHHARRAA